MGFDVRHAGEVGLGRASDPELLRAAAAEGRVVITRNYRDFGPLVETLSAREESFPGVLFLSPSIPQSDLAAHVRAIRSWCERAGAGNPVDGGAGWIDPT